MESLTIKVQKGSRVKRIHSQGSRGFHNPKFCFTKTDCYVLNHDFRFFAYRIVTRFYRSIHCGLVALIY